MAHILLVDDDDLARFAMREVLTRAGHDVTEAENGALGLSAQASTDFDVIITDIIMPEVEGIEFIIKIREQSPNIPVIAVSGGGRMSETDYLETARDLGANAILAKPFSEDQLNEKVAECLAAS
tara:strand:- start:70619 stop:70990 length:372 start_codon:yes stop_codon:yes gene_type:complete